MRSQLAEEGFFQALFIVTAENDVSVDVPPCAKNWTPRLVGLGRICRR